MDIESDGQIIKIINEWFILSRDWRKPMDAKVDRLYRKFRSYLDLDETYAHQSRIFIPESFNVIWTSLPTWLETVLGQSPYITASPTKKETEKGSAYATKLLESQLESIGEDKQGLYMAMLKVWQDAAMYGNGFFEVIWRYEEGLRRRRTPVYNTEPIEIPGLADDFGQPVRLPPGVVVMRYEETEETRVVYDAPDIKRLDWKDVYPDPASTTIQAPARFIITRHIRTEQEIDELSNDKRYKNLNKITFDMALNHPDLQDDRKEIDEVNDSLGASSGSNKFTEILRCQYARKEKGEWQEWISEVADRKTLILDKQTPYYHNRRTVIKADCFPVNNRFYAMGLLESAEDLQDGINQRFNQSADIVSMLLNPMFQVTKSLYDDIYDLYQGNLPATPGLMIPVGVNENITPIIQHAQLAPAGAEIQYLQDHLKTTTGTSDPMRGNLPNRAETATAIQTAEAHSGLRSRILMKIFWYTSLKPTAEIMLELNHQFMVDPHEIKMKNEAGVEEFMKIEMEDIPIDGVEIRPNITFINPAVSKQVRATMLEQFIARMGNSPFAEYINWRELGEIIFDLREIQNVSRLLKSDEEVQQARQQAAMLEQATQKRG